MPDRGYLDWPFLTREHGQLADEIGDWAGRRLSGKHPDDVDEACQVLLEQLADAGWLNHAAPAPEPGSARPLDVRSLCLIRETLAYHSGLADFVFAMQGLGSGGIALFGNNEQKHAYLPAVRSGDRIAAFALSEPESGSDVAAITTSAVADGAGYVINGEKTWISNGGIAGFYTLFARTGEEPGTRGLSAFIVDADTPGLEVAERIEVIAPHPLARITFNACRVPKTRLLGKPGEGFKIAMATLDVSSVPLSALQRLDLPGVRLG